MNEEQESLLLWANTQLLRANAAQFTLTNLSSDVRDGVRLARLVQVVTKVVSIGAYNPNPSQMWHAMQNASAILRFLSSHTFEKPEGVRASGSWLIDYFFCLFGLLLNLPNLGFCDLHRHCYGKR
jgi:hypothetical protein